MIPRDYRTTGQALGDNVRRFVETHPDAFEVLLYLPGEAETVAPSEDVVGSIETSERTITYADPVEGKAVKIPEGEPYEMVNAGGQAVQGDEAVMLILNRDVPKHTVIQYEEYTTMTDRRMVSLYVVAILALSQAPGSGEKYLCLPFPEFMDREA